MEGDIEEVNNESSFEIIKCVDEDEENDIGSGILCHPFYAHKDKNANLLEKWNDLYDSKLIHANDSDENILFDLDVNSEKALNSNKIIDEIYSPNRENLAGGLDTINKSEKLCHFSENKSTTITQRTNEIVTTKTVTVKYQLPAQKQEELPEYSTLSCTNPKVEFWSNNLEIKKREPEEYVAYKSLSDLELYNSPKSGKGAATSPSLISSWKEGLKGLKYQFPKYSIEVHNKPIQTPLKRIHQSGLNICNWLQSNLIRNIVETVQSTFQVIGNSIDPEMILSCQAAVELPAVCSFRESTIIRKAFAKVFKRRFVVRTLPCHFGSVAALPVGFSAGLLETDKKIRTGRHNFFPHKPIIAVASMVVETTPERWQYTTVISLDDLSKSLNLHNYTQTIPIPNVYIKEAQRRTPLDYYAKYMGFALSMEELMEQFMDGNSDDWQKYLTGNSYDDYIQSSAEALASMYKKYM